MGRARIPRILCSLIRTTCGCGDGPAPATAAEIGVEACSGSCRQALGQLRPRSDSSQSAGSLGDTSSSHPPDRACPPGERSSKQGLMGAQLGVD